MNMNVIAPIVGGVAGTGLALGGSAIYKKVSGKPAGVPGSVAHIVTNEKLDNKAKAEVLKEQFVESTKDTLKLGGAVAGTATAASLITGNSEKAANVFNKIKSKIGDTLAKCSINGKNLKDIVKNTKVFQKFNSLPTPAKAGITAGAALLALAAPVVSMVSAQKAGYIEGKHEE